MKDEKKKIHLDIEAMKKIDFSLDNEFSNVIDEIEKIQQDIVDADKKARKKLKKEFKKSRNEFYVNRYSVEARRNAASKISNRGYFQMIQEWLKKGYKIAIIIARLLSTLIVSILSLEPVQRSIRPETLKEMVNIYNIAMSI